MWTNEYQTEPYGTRGRHFFEPLKVEAPETAQPYCCYANTVVFYEDATCRKEVARCDSKWNLLGQRFNQDLEGLPGVAPFVWHEGELYELGSGDVVWHDDGWHVRWLGWRVPEDDWRWPYIPQPEVEHV